MKCTKYSVSWLSRERPLCWLEEDMQQASHPRHSGRHSTYAKHYIKVCLSTLCSSLHKEIQCAGLSSMLGIFEG